MFKYLKEEMSRLMPKVDDFTGNAEADMISQYKTLQLASLNAMTKADLVRELWELYEGSYKSMTLEEMADEVRFLKEQTNVKKI